MCRSGCEAVVMHFTSKHLFVLCWFAFAACAADAPNSDEEPTDENGSPATQTTKHADAGKSSAVKDAAVKDAAGKDATTQPASVFDAGHPVTHDAGSTAALPDASPTNATGDAGSSVAGSGETGRMVGMTAAHNAVRAMVMTSPMLADMVWDPEVAAYAQQWTDSLAASHCDAPMHRAGSDLQQKGYGENLAVFGGTGATTSPKQAVSGWAGEVACWTYGTISGLGVAGTEKCDTACYTNMHSDGCGHYTQVVWRSSTKVGCGVTTCKSSKGYQNDIWICNYSPAGNFVGRAPY